MSMVYIVDSAEDRKWVKATGKCVRYYNLKHFLDSSNNFDFTAADVVLFHGSDIKGSFDTLPSRLGDGKCSIVVFSGGAYKTNLEALETKMLGSKRTILKDHLEPILYKPEKIERLKDATESILWKYSIEPFLNGERKKFLIVTPNLIQYALAAKILVEFFFAHKVDSSLEGAQQWTDSEQIKAFWGPLFGCEIYKNFGCDGNDPYGWFEKLVEIEKIYKSNAPDWTSLKYEDFRPLIEAVE